MMRSRWGLVSVDGLLDRDAEAAHKRNSVASCPRNRDGGRFFTCTSASGNCAASITVHQTRRNGLAGPPSPFMQLTGQYDDQVACFYW